MQRTARRIGQAWALAAGLAWASLTAAAPPPRLGMPQFTPVGVGAIPRGVVAALAQDRTGFMWVATGDGLVRYDGYRFTPREREAGDAGRPAAGNLGWVRTMLSARDGRLWIGTEVDGLAVYDPATDRVALFGDPSLPAAAGRLRATTVRALAEDADGAIWVGMLGGGLLQVDPVSGRRLVLRQSDAAGGLPDDRVLALCVDRQGTLWVGTWRGLVRRPRGSERFEPVPAVAGGPLDGGIVQTLLEASDGHVWAGTQAGALLRLSPDAGRIEVLATTGGAVNALAEAGAGAVWVGRSDGLVQHDLAGRRVRTLQPDARRPGALAGSEVSALLVDRAGDVWVGGYGLGLQRHDPKPGGIALREPDAAADSPLASASARSLLVREGGELWAALQHGGVAVLDAELKAIGSLALPPPAAALGVRVQALAQARDGSAWLATGSHLIQVDRGRRPLRVLRHAAGEVYRLVTTTDGRVWLCAEDGLHRLAPGDAEPRRVGAAGSVFAAAEAPDGSLWIGSLHGLLRLAPEAAVPAPVPEREGAGLGSPVVLGLLFDRQGRLWLDTAVSGLHRLQPAADGQPVAFDRISERLGVAGRPFGVNLMEDARGRIWTQQHVYDPAADRVHELAEADGRAFGTGWFHSHARLPDGRFVFGGSHGMLVVQPERFEPSAYRPPLVVSALRVNGLPRPAAPALASLTVAPGQRSFGLEFAALDYADPARVRYAYRLEGFDPDWIATGADLRVAAYSNLAPGDYMLRVRATNRSGVWSDHELAVPVSVRPAWWQHRAAQGGAALLALLGLAALVQLRTRSLRAQRQALEHEVAQRTAALEVSSLTDPLTGLHNRRFLTQQLPADVALALRRHAEQRRRGGPPADDLDLVFFLIDIDHFKQVNDDHGHAAGDAVLVQMRDRLQQAFREGDHLVRWGGEEFLIVARDTSRARAAELAERVRTIVAATPFTLDEGRQVVRTCSVGFAAFPLSPEHPQALDWSVVVDLADAALFIVKRRGRDGWLGLLGAQADAPQALRAWARQPLAAWLDSGTLRTVSSAPPAGAARDPG